MPVTPSFLRRILCLSLSVTVLFTQCLFAHKPETTLWGERRKAQQPVQLAALPNVVALGEHSRMTNESKIEAMLPYGSIRKITNPQSPSTKSQIIIHIQDIHLNPEAQKNIGAAIGELVKTGQVEAVALEGAFGDIDLKPFQEFPYQDSVKKAADYLLREKKIAGPLHSLLSLGSGNAFGVDDRQHYNANIEAYRQAAPLQKSAKEKIVTEQRRLIEQKTKTLNAGLLAFDQHVEAYRSGTLPFGSYVKELKAASLQLKADSAVQTFLDALHLENTLNFTRVEAERSHLLSLLMPKLDKAATDNLVAATIAYRSGRVPHAEFYSTLQRLCEKNGVSLSRFPAMNNYLRYVLLSDRIDAEHLFAEMKQLENQAYASLIKTPAEKELIERSKTAHLAGKLVEFALTREEWNEYKSVSSLEFETWNLEFFKNFYQQAEIRDEKMAMNLLRETRNYRLQTLNSKLIILVTGGFHSSGIDQKLVDAGHTVISFVPKITKVDTESGSAYLSVFTQEKTPLEKLFEGQKLFLANQAYDGIVRGLLTSVTAADAVRAHGEAAQPAARNLLLSVLSLRAAVIMAATATAAGVLIRILPSADALNGIDVQFLADGAIQSLLLTPLSTDFSFLWTLLLACPVFCAMAQPVFNLYRLRRIPSLLNDWKNFPESFLKTSITYLYKRLGKRGQEAVYWATGYQGNTVRDFLDGLRNLVVNEPRQRLPNVARGTWKAIDEVLNNLWKSHQKTTSSILLSLISIGGLLLALMIYLGVGFELPFFGGGTAAMAMMLPAYPDPKALILTSSPTETDANVLLNYIDRNFLNPDGFRRLQDDLREKIVGHPEWPKEGATFGEAFKKKFGTEEVTLHVDKIEHDLLTLSPDLVEFVTRRQLDGEPIDMLWHDMVLQHDFGGTILPNWASDENIADAANHMARVFSERLFLAHMGALIMALQVDASDKGRQTEARQLMLHLDQMLKRRNAVSENRVLHLAPSLAEMSILVTSHPIYPRDWNVSTNFVSAYPKITAGIKERLRRDHDASFTSPIERQLISLEHLARYWPDELQLDYRCLSALALLHHLENQIFNGSKYKTTHEEFMAHTHNKLKDNLPDVGMLAAHVPYIMDAARVYSTESGNSLVEKTLLTYLRVAPDLILINRSYAEEKHSPYYAFIQPEWDFPVTHRDVLDKAQAHLTANHAEWKKLPVFGDTFTYRYVNEALNRRQEERQPTIRQWHEDRLFRHEGHFSFDADNAREHEWHRLKWLLGAKGGFVVAALLVLIATSFASAQRIDTGRCILPADSPKMLTHLNRSAGAASKGDWRGAEQALRAAAGKPFFVKKPPTNDEVEKWQQDWRDDREKRLKDNSLLLFYLKQVESFSILAHRLYLGALIRRPAFLRMLAAVLLAVVSAGVLAMIGGEWQWGGSSASLAMMLPGMPGQPQKDVLPALDLTDDRVQSLFSQEITLMKGADEEVKGRYRENNPVPVGAIEFPDRRGTDHYRHARSLIVKKIDDETPAPTFTYVHLLAEIFFHLESGLPADQVTALPEEAEERLVALFRILGIRNVLEVGANGDIFLARIINRCLKQALTDGQMYLIDQFHADRRAEKSGLKVMAGDARYLDHPALFGDRRFDLIINSGVLSLGGATSMDGRYLDFILQDADDLLFSLVQALSDNRSAVVIANGLRTPLMLEYSAVSMYANIHLWDNTIKRHRYFDDRLKKTMTYIGEPGYERFRQLRYDGANAAIVSPLAVRPVERHRTSSGDRSWAFVTRFFRLHMFHFSKIFDERLARYACYVDLRFERKEDFDRREKPAGYSGGPVFVEPQWKQSRDGLPVLIAVVHENADPAAVLAGVEAFLFRLGEFDNRWDDGYDLEQALWQTQHTQKNYRQRRVMEESYRNLPGDVPIDPIRIISVNTWKSSFVLAVLAAAVFATALKMAFVMTTSDYWWFCLWGVAVFTLLIKFAHPLNAVRHELAHAKTARWFGDKSAVQYLSWGGLWRVFFDGDRRRFVNPWSEGRRRGWGGFNVFLERFLRGTELQDAGIRTDETFREQGQPVRYAAWQALVMTAAGPAMTFAMMLFSGVMIGLSAYWLYPYGAQGPPSLVVKSVSLVLLSLSLPSFFVNAYFLFATALDASPWGDKTPGNDFLVMAHTWKMWRTPWPEGPLLPRFTEPLRMGPGMPDTDSLNDALVTNIRPPVNGTHVTGATLLQWLQSKAILNPEAMSLEFDRVTANVYETVPMEGRADHEAGWPVLIVGNVWKEIEGEGVPLTPTQIEKMFGLRVVKNPSTNKQLQVRVRMPQHYGRVGFIDGDFTVLLDKDGNVRDTYFGKLGRVPGQIDSDSVFHGHAMEFKGLGAKRAAGSWNRLGEKQHWTFEEAVEALKLYSYRESFAGIFQNEIELARVTFAMKRSAAKVRLNPINSDSDYFYCLIRLPDGTFVADVPWTPDWLEELNAHRSLPGLYLIPYQPLESEYRGVIGGAAYDGSIEAERMQAQAIKHGSDPAVITIGKVALQSPWHLGQEYRVQIGVPIRLTVLDKFLKHDLPIDRARFFQGMGRQTRAALDGGYVLDGGYTYKDINTEAKLADYGELVFKSENDLEAEREQIFTIQKWLEGLLQLFMDHAELSYGSDEHFDWIQLYLTGLLPENDGANVYPSFVKRLEKMLEEIAVIPPLGEPRNSWDSNGKAIKQRADMVHSCIQRAAQYLAPMVYEEWEYSPWGDKKSGNDFLVMPHPFSFRLPVSWWPKIRPYLRKLRLNSAQIRSVEQQIGYAQKSKAIIVRVGNKILAAITRGINDFFEGARWPLIAIELANVIEAHEEAHLQLPRELVVEKYDAICDFLGQTMVNKILFEFARAFGYSPDTDKFILMEEIIAYTFHESIWGNPLRVLMAGEYRTQLLQGPVQEILLAKLEKPATKHLSVQPMDEESRQSAQEIEKDGDGETFQQETSPESGNQCYVLKQDDRVVAYLVYRMDGPVVEVLRLAVHSQYRKQEIGQFFIKKLIAKQKRDGHVDTIVIPVSAVHNVDARVLLSMSNFESETYADGETFYFYYLRAPSELKRRSSGPQDNREDETESWDGDIYGDFRNFEDAPDDDSVDWWRTGVSPDDEEPYIADDEDLPWVEERLPNLKTPVLPEGPLFPEIIDVQDDDYNVTMTAMVDGVAVGFAFVTPTDEGFSIRNFRIRPGFERRGVGRALVAHLEDRLANSLLPAAYIDINHEWTAETMLHFFQAMGWKAVGIEENDEFDISFIRMQITGAEAKRKRQGAINKFKNVVALISYPLLLIDMDSWTNDRLLAAKQDLFEKMTVDILSNAFADRLNNKRKRHALIAAMAAIGLGSAVRQLIDRWDLERNGSKLKAAKNEIAYDFVRALLGDANALNLEVETIAGVQRRQILDQTLEKKHVVVYVSNALADYFMNSSSGRDNLFAALMRQHQSGGTILFIAQNERIAKKIDSATGLSKNCFVEIASSDMFMWKKRQGMQVDVQAFFHLLRIYGIDPADTALIFPVRVEPMFNGINEQDLRVRWRRMLEDAVVLFIRPEGIYVKLSRDVEAAQAAGRGT